MVCGTTAGAADSKISNRPATFEFESNLEASQDPNIPFVRLCVISNLLLPLVGLPIILLSVILYSRPSCLNDVSVAIYRSNLSFFFYFSEHILDSDYPSS